MKIASNSLLLSLVATIGAFSGAPSYTTSALAMTPPPFRCVSDRSAFCLSNLNFIISEPRLVNGLIELRFYEEFFPDQFAIVRHEAQCNRVRSNTLKLLGYSPYYRLEDREYVMAIFRLRTEGDCNLTIIAPAATVDRSLGGLSMALGQIRVCATRGCEGRSLISAIPRAWRLFGSYRSPETR